MQAEAMVAATAEATDVHSDRSPRAPLVHKPRSVPFFFCLTRRRRNDITHISNTNIANHGRIHVKSLWTIMLTFVILALTGGNAAQVRSQESTIQPAHYLETGTVVVVQQLRDGRHSSHSVIVAKAMGFATDDCDFVTTFDVVSKYEERETWEEVHQRIEVFIAGELYEGRLRPVGVYPMGLDLACIDLAPTPSGKHRTTHPLPLETASPSVPYEGDLPPGMVPGAPLFNDKKRVVGMFDLTTDGTPVVISSSNIRRFLKEARRVPRAWPSSPSAIATPIR